MGMINVMLMYFYFLISALISPSEGKIHYHTHFQKCPKKKLGPYVQELSQIYEKNQSLYKINHLLQQNRNKFFYYDYKVHYNGIYQKLGFEFFCPRPLFKIPKKRILNHLGQIMDTKEYDYEEELLGENILRTNLPYLSIDSEFLKDSHLLGLVAQKIDNIPLILKEKLSEFVFTKEKMVLLFTHQNRPIEVYLDGGNWPMTIDKGLKALVELIHQNKAISKMNLTLENKIIVRLAPGSK